MSSVSNSTEASYVSEKNAAAVALGRKGGLKGGFARAKALTSERRLSIAKAAAKARWAARVSKKT